LLDTSNVGSRTVSVLDDQTGTVRHTEVVGMAPSDVEVDDANNHVFIANTGSDTVSILDDKTGSVLRVIPVGQRQGHTGEAACAPRCVRTRRRPSRSARRPPWPSLPWRR
jgi:YVTN family beta-propeller protein